MGLHSLLEDRSENDEELYNKDVVHGNSIYFLLKQNI